MLGNGDGLGKTAAAILWFIGGGGVDERVEVGGVADNRVEGGGQGCVDNGWRVEVGNVKLFH
ncbi:hypothetical protein LguiB_018526 [Lonicera macranthoides]